MKPRRQFLQQFGTLVGFATLAGCGAGMRPPEPPTLPPLPAIRRIVLSHPPSKEKIDVIYFANGRYDAKVMTAISSLLRDRNTGAVGAIDPLLIDFLFDLLQRTGLPQSTEVVVLSGFRSAETNAALIKAGAPAARESFHVQGKALDFRVPVLPGSAVNEIAKTMQRGGAAYYPTSGHTHIDVGAVRTWKTG